MRELLETAIYGGGALLGIIIGVYEGYRYVKKRKGGEKP